MENKIYLPGTDYYYRIGNKVYNKRNQELIPDYEGRVKLKIYRGKYMIYRPPGDYNRPERVDINSITRIPGFSNYYYDEYNNIYNKHRKLLKPNNNSYYLKNDNGEWKRVMLRDII